MQTAYAVALSPRWGTADAEIKGAPGGSSCLSKLPSLYAFSRSEYSLGALPAVTGLPYLNVASFCLPGSPSSFSRNVSTSLTVECVLSSEPECFLLVLEIH